MEEILVKINHLYGTNVFSSEAKELIVFDRVDLEAYKVR